MAGRKPKPSNVHHLHGNPGKRAGNKREPKPRRGVPKPPAWIEPDTEAMATWEELAAELNAMEVLTLADRAALAALVSAYRDWLAADEAIVEHGLTQERGSEKTGFSIIARPEVAIRSDAWRRYKSMLIEFGLTPSARTRVAATLDPKASPLAEFLEDG